MDMKEIFDGFDPSLHEEEVKRRWGETDAYEESTRRAKKYAEKDWREIKAAQEAVYADAMAAKRAGKRASDEEVMEIAERHRLIIDRWFYPCTAAMHRGLADLYESDHRFAENIDKHGEGLTAYLVEAIRANSRRPGR